MGIEFSTYGLTIVIGAFILAVVDTSIGMFYGTLLTPLLIVCGYPPQIAVPTVLLSQIFVDFVGSTIHIQVKNVKRRDLRTAIIILVPSTILSGIGAFVNICIPPMWTKLYMTILLAVLGFLLLLGIRLKKSKKKLFLFSILAGFNKGFIGGGFGPVIVSGQIMLNQDVKPSVAIGDLTKVFVCSIGVLVYFEFVKELMYDILFATCVPAIIGALVGPHITKKLKGREVSKVFAICLLLLSALMIIKLKYNY